jgi:outer membrane protein assembly factor BamB
LVYEYTTEVEGEDVDHVTLFVGTMEGELAAYDLLESDRPPLWTIPLDETVLYGPPVVSEDYVYIGTSGGTVYKLAVDNSEASMPAPLGSLIVGGVAVGLDRVFVGTTDGVLHALNADTMIEEWRYPAAGTTLSNRIWGTPVVDEAGGMVYFGSFDHTLYALDATDGSVEWTFEADGAIAGKPLIYNDNVYFGSFDRKFYAVDKTDGTPAWATPFAAGNWFWTEPIVYDDTIYVGCLDHKVYALNPSTGAKKSEFQTNGPITSPSVAAVLPGANKVLGDDDDVDMIVVASNTGMVHALDPANLAIEKWSYDFKQPIQSPMSAHVGVYGDNFKQFVYIYGLNSSLTARWLTTGGPAGWDIITGQ